MSGECAPAQASKRRLALFSSFSGSVDFTDIELIAMNVTPLFPAADLQIDFIESTFIPEPSTALLLGIGLVALGVRRR